jgi:hypothetical protein
LYNMPPAQATSATLPQLRVAGRTTKLTVETRNARIVGGQVP